MKHNTGEKVIEGNKLIAEFMELLWFELDGRLSVGKSFADTMEEARYHSNWDWQIPAQSKLFHLMQKFVSVKKIHYLIDRYLRLCDKYNEAVFINNPSEGFSVILEALEWYSHHTTNDEWYNQQTK